MDIKPAIVAHADWSVASTKRWLALAVLEAGAYRALPPQPVGDPQTLLSRLRAQAGPDGEDRFDAVVGLFGLLNIVLGRRPSGDPTDPAIRRIEGWILGQLENREKDKP